MADIAFGSVESIVKIALAIKDAVQTVKQNQKECSDIEKCVTRCSFLLQRLEVKTGITKDEAMRYPLKDVAESLEDALQLVVKCQRKHYVSHLWKAADMAKELRRVQEDIVRKLQMGDFATNVHNTIMLTNIHNNAGAPLPPARPPLEASALSDDTIPDEVVPGFSQFSYSYLKAATKNFREIIGEGGTSEVYKGILHDGQVVAIKNVHRIGFEDIEKSTYDTNIFINLKHKNILRPMGYCHEISMRLFSYEGRYVGVQDGRFFFVEEYASNGSIFNLVTGMFIMCSLHSKIITVIDFYYYL